MKNSTLIKLVTITCACIIALFVCFPVEAERAAELDHSEMYSKPAITKINQIDSIDK